MHEVKSGQLIAPGIPELAERELMQKLVDTYDKIFHTWHTDQGHTLPTGHPMLMMGFTADGQANPELVADRDRRLDISSQEKRRQRENIQAPPVAPGANAWERGDVVQLSLVRGPSESRMRK
jgi:hypothetical protein